MGMQSWRRIKYVEKICQYMGTGKLLIKLYSVNKHIISGSLSTRQQKQMRVQLEARVLTLSISSSRTFTTTNNIIALCNFHNYLLLTRTFWTYYFPAYNTFRIVAMFIIPHLQLTFHTKHVSTSVLYLRTVCYPSSWHRASIMDTKLQIADSHRLTAAFNKMLTYLLHGAGSFLIS